MWNNKKTRMFTRDEKIVTKNNMVLKMNGQNIKGVRFNMKNFILGNRGHEDIEG
jgi:hypothetical protein